MIFLQEVYHEEAACGNGCRGHRPGRATIARELARAGEDALVLEKGRGHLFPVGIIQAYAAMYDIRRSREGVLVRRGTISAAKGTGGYPGEPRPSAG